MDNMHHIEAIFIAKKSEKKPPSKSEVKGVQAAPPPLTYASDGVAVWKRRQRITRCRQP